MTICNQWGRQVPKQEGLVSAGCLCLSPSPLRASVSSAAPVAEGRQCCLGSSRKGRAGQLPPWSPDFLSDHTSGHWRPGSVFPHFPLTG